MARAILHGFAVSSGIAIGKAVFANRKHSLAPHILLSLDALAKEQTRFEHAVATVAQEFIAARQNLAQELAPHTDILDLHLLICKDPKLHKEVIRGICEHHMNAEWALEEALESISQNFNHTNSPYISDRMQDIRAVAGRIMRVLCNTPQARPTQERSIVLAQDLTPADALHLALNKVLGFATEEGGKTAHTGILARSLGIAAIVGANGLDEEAKNGDIIILDGLSGKVLIDPDEAELEIYYDRDMQFATYQRNIQKQAHLPAETLDGNRLNVLANIEGIAGAQAAQEAGAQGIGLVRTELSCIARNFVPKEQELYEEYAHIATTLAPHKVVFRTLDLGADKVFGAHKELKETNPALGVRSLRYCLRHQDIFRRQMRAILRASAHGNVAMMFPMVSGVTELRLAKSLLDESKQELINAGIAFAPNLPIGAMIELPSAVLTADTLAAEVDFFSIGTNDLIQYILGVDRENRHVAHLHQPLHPAVIKAIKYVVDMAHKVGIPVCVCGEMAADPYCLPILLGMPVDELSVPVQLVPGIKHLVREVELEACQNLLYHALAAPTAQMVNSMVSQAVHEWFPSDIQFFMSHLNVNTV